MSLSRKHLALVTLLFGLITISSKYCVECRSVSGWITANYPDMYNEHVKQRSDRRRLQLLLAILRRKIDLTGAINAAVQQNKSGHIRFIHLIYFILRINLTEVYVPKLAIAQGCSPVFETEGTYVYWALYPERGVGKSTFSLTAPV